MNWTVINFTSALIPIKLLFTYFLTNKGRTNQRYSKICMYVMIGKGQIAQKYHIGAKIDLRAKFMGKYNCLLKARWSCTDATARGKRFQFLTILHAKLFLLLRVLPVCWSSLSDDLLSPGLLENLNSLDASRSIWWNMILWVSTKSFLILLFATLVPKS